MVVHERLPLPVRRQHKRDFARKRIRADARVRHDVTGDAPAPGPELDVALILLVFRELERAERKLVGIVRGVGGNGDRRRQSRIVEQGARGGRRGIDDQEIGTSSRRVAEPEAVAVLVPLRCYAVAEHQARREPGEHLFGASIPLHDGPAPCGPVRRRCTRTAALGATRE